MAFRQKSRLLTPPRPEMRFENKVSHLSPPLWDHAASIDRNPVAVVGALAAPLGHFRHSFVDSMFPSPSPTPKKCYIYPTMSDPSSDPSGDPFALPEIELPPRAGASPAPRPMPYLDGLNEAQKAAVLAVEGPVLVLSGAGTGKTRVLTTRLAHIIHQGLARPWEVMAVTFTNKAAREMKNRIERLVGMPVERLWLGTFHALGARILRRHAELAGLKPNFTILDADDQLRLVKQLLEAELVDDKRWPARAVLALIQRWKDRGLGPERVPAGEGGEMAAGRILELYALYQGRLKTLNACDFGDLLLHCLAVFTQHPEVLKEYQERLKYILVDEYQDTNVAQYLWLRLLVQKHKNICCVGDDDQCLAAGTLVTMADGSLCPIERVRKGDSVLSGYGSGDFRPAAVTRTFRGRHHGDGIAISLRSGRRLTATAGHTCFAGYRLGAAPQLYFTYLMHKRGVGWRLGTSQVYTKGQKKPVVGFRQRLLQEHGDELWIVGTHASESEARADEYILSLIYRLPTLPFVARKGKSTRGLVSDPAMIARIFATFDTESGARRLLSERGLSPAHPHHRPRSRNSNRRNVVITLCGDRRGRSPMHRISIVGNDSEGRKKLSTLGFSVRPAKAGSESWRFETARSDFAEISRIVEEIGKAFSANLIFNARLGANRGAVLEGNALPFIPAASITPGMVMFDGTGGYDVVERVKPAALDAPVYDIDVARTHNFIANGVVTHNSIYSWRGAEVGNILRFEKDFPGARIIRLEQNYRSTGHILGAAAELIAKNEGRLGKTLWTAGESGRPLSVRGFWDGEAEARADADEIEALQRAGHELGSIAILVRAGFQTREFEERFITLGMPYRVIGGLRFYERQEIRDAIAYLRVIVQPDDDLAFERIVNTPRRGIGTSTLQAVHRLARAGESSLTAAAGRLIETDELKARARTALAGLLQDFARWRSLAAAVRHVELAETVLDEAGYTAMWQADKSADAPGRLENLKELVRALEEFESLEGFLDHVSLVMENEEANARDQVNLMTLHSAKGLEFDVVFLPGWEEGLFPHQRALDEGGLAALEEERRLAYVGLTRARTHAYISFAANRRVHNQWQSAIPSRFIGELPPERIDVETAPGLYGGVGTEAGAPAAQIARSFGYASGGARRARVIEGEVLGRASPEGLHHFAAGMRVFHQKFGNGNVLAVDGDKLKVAFDHAGEKMVIASFVAPV